MEKLSNSLQDIFLNKVNSDFEKWQGSGLLDVIKDDETKLKVIEAFNLAEGIINSDNTFRSRISIIVFPAIVRIHKKSDNYNIHDNFVFDKEKMEKFINYISDCFDTYNYEKHLKNIDVEAELLVKILDMYIREQNTIFKKLKNK